MKPFQQHWLGRFVMLILLLLASRAPLAQQMQWKPLTGILDFQLTGTYGSQGIPSPHNYPGRRQEAMAWTGADGKFYLLGGYIYDEQGLYTYHNDLWRYDPANGSWTWLKGSQESNQPGIYGTLGVAAPANTPGAREGGATWTSADGKLYLFGGWGFTKGGVYGILNDLWCFDPASGNWTWIKGSQLTRQPGVYGTQGIAAAANMPGARKNAAAWTGADGKFYLFGGYDDYLWHNDLWRFDPASGNWTWIKGSQLTNQHSVYGTLGQADPANTPGARQGATAWTGADGTLYLFGGYVCDEQESDYYCFFNDLWRFDPASGNWTWIKGSQKQNQSGGYGTLGQAAVANTPGAREGAVAWAGAEGKLYLFGGYGYDQAHKKDSLNDLWRFDPASGNWTWIKGSSSINQSGIYGAQGLAAAANTPGARDGAVAWAGAGGKLYLFGGKKYYRHFNDLWRFDLASGNWTWMNGSQGEDQHCIYGTLGQPAAANTPGSRKNAAAWTGTDGKFYLFGGLGYDQWNYFGSLNDLWRLDPASGNWAWIKGRHYIDESGVYGTQNVAAAANTPGSCEGAAAWTGADGKLYLFGGHGYRKQSIYTYSVWLNDLWRFDPASGNWTWLKGGPDTDESGVYGTQGLAAAANTPGTRQDAAAWTGADGKLYLFGGGYLSGGGAYNDLWRFDPISGNWTWLKGSQFHNKPGVYGTQGVAAAANTPGARKNAATWTGTDGKFYLFGGYKQYDAVLNDLWCFDPASGNWTWLKGSQLTNQPGVYGIQGRAAAANTPGAREGGAAWTGADGKLYLFGGGRYIDCHDYDYSDLWCFDLASGNWTWLKGSQVVNQPGFYHTRGVTGAANNPGARTDMAAWPAPGGKLYLFGGYGYDCGGYNNYLGDLWCYEKLTSAQSWQAYQ